MARIFTTPETELTAKAFMHDVMVTAGIRSSQRKGSVCQMAHPVAYPSTKNAAKAICDELVNRDFKNIDDSINQLTSEGFYDRLDDTGTYKSYKPEAIAKAIVYMAELTNIYWDDTAKTPYEIDEFKSTLLGNAVYKYGRYISAIKDPKAAKSSSAVKSTSASSSSTAAPSTSSASAGSSGKPIGPQSANIRDLRDPSGNPGTPGQKVTASGSLMFKIVGDKGSGKNTPNAFVNPISRSGAAGNTNKVKFSSGNGWTDCTCMFDDLNDAQDFLAKLLANDQAAVNANARIVKFTPDPNGYFLVGTEYGMCAISARKMNEALAEAAKLTEERGECWERATEGYDHKELRELHDWMRRD